MTLTYTLVVAAALFACGLGSLLARRTALGALLGFELMLAAAILTTAVLTTLSGSHSALGQVVAAVLVGVGAAVGVLMIGAHLAGQAVGGARETPPG